MLADSLFSFCTRVLVVTCVLLSGCAYKSSAIKTKKQPQANQEKIVPPVAKKIKDMTLEEALQALPYYRAYNNESSLAVALERVVTLEKSPEVIEPLLQELAALKEKQGNLEEAQALYEQYLLLYPGTPHVDDIHYRLISIMNRRALGPDRDQNITKKTKDRAEQFLKLFPKSDHAAAIKEILGSSVGENLEHELGRVFFYIQKYTYTNNPSALNAARKRLIGVIDRLKSVGLKISDILARDLQAMKDEKFTQQKIDMQYLEMYRLADEIMRAIYESKVASVASKKISAKSIL